MVMLNANGTLQRHSNTLLALDKRHNTRQTHDLNSTLPQPFMQRCIELSGRCVKVVAALQQRRFKCFFFGCVEYDLSVIFGCSKGDLRLN